MNKEYYLAITGATGTIGLAIIKECINRNKTVLAICGIGSSRRNLIPDSPLIDIIECDISEYAQLATTGCVAQKFIHLAWTSTKNAETRNQVGEQEKNIRYALDAVDLAHRLGCDTYVGSGSQAEYGRKSEILMEDTPCTPETAYGMAKLCAGQMTRMACRSLGIKHIWPRILSVYGENCAAHTIIAYTMNELLKGRRPSLSSGDQIWDFIYAKDAANAMLALADRGHDGEVYLVASGVHRPLKEFLMELRDAINPKLELGFGDVAYGPGTVMYLAADVSKIKRDTGFEPNYSFVDGIEEMIH